MQYCPSKHQWRLEDNDTRPDKPGSLTGLIRHQCEVCYQLYQVQNRKVSHYLIFPD